MLAWDLDDDAVEEIIFVGDPLHVCEFERDTLQCHEVPVEGILGGGDWTDAATW